ncbi:hypothetical protein XHV734_1143 [Xanthomonas hortorum pv. vitians]|nr:hypothetical protein XHV734_1143 [Xanthomonas hortorum pv. vitians]
MAHPHHLISLKWQRFRVLPLLDAAKALLVEGTMPFSFKSKAWLVEGVVPSPLAGHAVNPSLEARWRHPCRHTVPQAARTPHQRVCRLLR